jgi:hypothetical protein
MEADRTAHLLSMYGQMEAQHRVGGGPAPLRKATKGQLEAKPASKMAVHLVKCSRVFRHSNAHLAAYLGSMALQVSCELCRITVK